MGWRLAEEIAANRPADPGREWWTLLDIAQNANDYTRQGMPGLTFLMARSKASKRTIYRRLAALVEAGLIKVVAQSSPGHRAVYEIPIYLTGNPLAEQVPAFVAPVAPEQVPAFVTPETGASVRGTRTSERVTENEQQVPPYVGTPLVITPVTNKNPPNGSAVTGTGGRERGRHIKPKLRGRKNR